MSIDLADASITVARTAIVVVAVLGMLRLFGNRHAGERKVTDLLMVLIVANAVQNAMTRASGSLATAFLCAGTLLLLARGWSQVGSLFPAIEKSTMGRPRVLAYDGHAVAKNLRRDHVTMSELMMAVREQGLASLDEVRLAVLEADGSVAVIPRTSREDRGDD